LMSSPRLLILDEPASGLDPAGVAHLRRVLEDIRVRDCTILVSSHLLGEVEQVCDSVAIIDHGRLVASGTIESLTAGPTAWRLIYSRGADATGAAAVLEPRFSTSVDGNVVSAIARSEGEEGPLALVAAVGLLPAEVRREQQRLE